MNQSRDHVHPPVHVILARDANDGIGMHGRIPWTCRGDMAFFRRVTSTTSRTTHTNSVVVGHRTRESMPTHLPGRSTRTMNRDGTFSVPDATEHVFLGGGRASLLAYFQRCMCGDAPWPETLIISRIHGTYECDTVVSDRDLCLDMYTRSVSWDFEDWSVDVYVLKGSSRTNYPPEIFFMLNTSTSSLDDVISFNSRRDSDSIGSIRRSRTV